MVSPIDIIIPSVKGALSIVMFGFIMYGIYWLLKKGGIFGRMSKSFRAKPTEQIYEDTATMIGEGNFKSFGEKISKYPEVKQKQYIDAYIELKNLQMQDLKGGKNGKK